MLRDYKIQCVRKKVFSSRKTSSCLCAFLTGFLDNRENKTTVFNSPFISKYKINFQLFIRHGSFVLLSLHFICLILVHLVKELALTEMITDVVLIEENRFLYFVKLYIGSPGEVGSLPSVRCMWELWVHSSA